MSWVTPRRRRARPVADAPLDALLPRVEDLAKGWLVALLEQAPLHEAPGIVGDALTRDGPRVCDAALRALADEADLRRLQAGGALAPLAARVGELAGASDPGAVSRAVDALHGVLWAALRDELRGSGGAESDLIADLAERLTLVCELLRAAALGRPAGGGERELSAVADEPPGARAAPVEPPPTGGWSTGPAGDEPAPPPGAPAPGVAAPEAGGPLWVSALEDEVRQSGAGAGPLSLLLAELEDADRVVASAAPERAGAAFGDFVQALRGVVRARDILVCESDARAWVIARETARSGAHSLGTRIAEAVGESVSWAGVPLAASVGVAVLGEDGRNPGELIEAAEEARFAASARGVEVSRRIPDRDRR